MNQEKIADLKNWMHQEKIDFTYISDPGHIAYFSGYESEPHERVLALFIAADDQSFLFTPALEVEDAEKSSWTYPVYGYLDSENPWEKIAALLNKRTQGTPRFALEKQALSQLIKTEPEIQRLLEAGSWADVAFEIGFKAIQAGVAEQEIVAEIEYQLKRQGIRSMSFDTLVLTGKNGASPHGVPGETKIEPHDLVLFDLGVVHNGYCSDATRTVSYLEPSDFQKEIYGIVLEAQLAATEAVKPGVTAGELDDIARGVITKAGYGEYFNHRLGHGIGTTVHEYPSLVHGNDLVIEEGMCFSIEPGIYIPGKVGVRIEDCLHVTKTGSEPFTKTTKELQIIQ